MQSSSVDCRVSSLALSALALMLALGCSGAGGSASSGSTSTSGGTTSDGGSSAKGGSSLASSTNPSFGGNSSNGGASGGGVAGSGGNRTSSSIPASGGSDKGGTTNAGGTTKGGTTSTGGTVGSGGTTAKGGTTSTGTTTNSGGVPAKDAGAGVDGASGTGTDGGSLNCSAPMPSGGKTYTGKSVYGTANGLGYGIWTSGSGGSITVFTDAHAFSAAWDNSEDFLAHLGLDFRPAKEWSTYGTITAEFSEVKSGTAGGFSMIGMYGWTNSPCVEWYINEDSWNGLGGGGSVTATIDGGTYYLKTLQTNGTGGANACESGHTGTWTQMISTRKGARTCGIITVSDHFAAWEKQGWKMGALTSVHINVEVGGGKGTIDFPIANVTTTNK
jgi:endo-1,4-beta-xylanase